MRFAEFLERYVYVRTCVGCGERMGYDYREEAFCDACRIAFERAKVMSCPECFGAMAECRCIPKSLSSAGVLEYRKLVAYIADRSSCPENKLLYFLKHKKNKRVALFVANQLLYKVDEMLSANGLCRDDAVLTYVPRSRRSYSKYGVDQAKLVCETISEVSGIECLPLIKRRGYGRHEQKSLGRSKRMQNAVKSFWIDEEYISECSSRPVILFDDIVTSGASMATVAKLLGREGIEKIFALSIAYSVKEKSRTNFIFR